MKLYDFNRLKDFVKSNFGIDPDDVVSDFQTIRVELNLEEVKTRVHESEDGFEYEDEDGNRYKGFLYIEKGYNKRTARERGWNTIVPKFHIYNCQTINSQKYKDNFDGHYVFSQQPEKMEDLDGEVKYLPICKYCLRKSKMIDRVINTKEYYEDYIKESDGKDGFSVQEMPKQYTVDTWGYTPDWAKVTANYRAKHNYTCENCGIPLNKNLSDAYYLDTHHISGNKTNNKDSNLRCLCVLCHSKVDEVHQRNFSKGHNKRRLRDFLDIFGEELKKLGVVGNIDDAHQRNFSKGNKNSVFNNLLKVVSENFINNR